MELREIVKVLLRRWLIVGLPTVIALGFALAGFLREPVAGGFAASMRFTAATPPEAYEAAGYEDGAYYPWLASEYVVNGLVDWVRTSSFTEAVSARLAADDLAISPFQLRSVLTADNTRSIIDVGISWPDEAQLGQIAAAVVAVMTEDAAAVFPQFGEAGVEVVLLDAPQLSPVPPAITSRLEPVIRVAIGLVAGVALAFLAEYLDPSLRDRHQVEALGYSVIAEIPSRRR